MNILLKDLYGLVEGNLIGLVASQNKAVITCIITYFYRTFRAAWECLKYQTDRVAQEHQECSQGIAEALKRLAEFSEKQKTKRKMVVEVLIAKIKLYM